MPEQNISRIDIPFTNEHFANWCLQMAAKKSPYWYGTCVAKASTSLLNSKTTQYPSHYGSSRTSRYKQDIANKQVVADCVGGCKGYAWSGGGIGVLESIGSDRKFTSKYGSNNCPDKSANGMFSYCKSKGMDWGTISTLPEIVGLALFTDGHVGYYVGNGYAVEWRGFNYGCVKTRVKDRSWKNWAKLPFIDYGDASTTVPAATATTTYVLGSRSLKKGSKGSDVKTLQELLNQLNIVTPALELDGDFGSKTEAAVKAFQKKAGIEVDGIYGEESHKALMDAVADDDEGKKAQEGAGETMTEEPTEPVAEPVTDEPVAPSDPSEPSTPTSAPTKVTIVCTSGTVNIRRGNRTAFSRITAVKSGTVLPYIASAANGWHAVLLESEIGWVSGNYSKVD